MNSKEALHKLQYYSCDNLETNKLCEIISKDLELLEILKKGFYEHYYIDSIGKHSLLFRFYGTPEYKKIVEWLGDRLTNEELAK